MIIIDASRPLIVQIAAYSSHQVPVPYPASGPHQTPRLPYRHPNGGVNGRKLRLIALDDGNEPARTAANLRQLIEKDNLLAIIGDVGNPAAIFKDGQFVTFRWSDRTALLHGGGAPP
jgi:Periplasmic binding protein